MENLKQLKEEFGNLHHEMTGIKERCHADGERAMNSDEKQTWDRMHTRVAELRELIDTQSRFASLEETKAEPQKTQAPYLERKQVITSRDYDNAFKCWALTAGGHANAITPAMRMAADKTKFGTLQTSQMFMRSDLGGMDSADNTAGKYTVNDGFVAGIEKSLKAYGGVRSVATVRTTDTGEPMRFVTNDDTTNSGAILAQSNDVSTTNFTFGSVSLGAFKYATAAFGVSVELLQDSQVNISDFVSEGLGTRLARVTCKDYTDGTGTNEPYGIVVRSAKGGDADSTSAVSEADLRRVFHAVDPAYRANASWMMNDTTLSQIENLDDSNGRPLWHIDLTQGSPDRLFGKSITINQNMADPAASAKSVLFGDMSKYIIRDVAGISVVVLKERWAEYFCVGFIGHLRTDGNLINTAAVKHLLH